MKDILGNIVNPGDTIVFGEKVKVNQPSYARSPLTTGTVDHISLFGTDECCFVLTGSKTATGKPQFYRLETKNILKLERT